MLTITASPGLFGVDRHGRTAPIVGWVVKEEEQRGLPIFSSGIACCGILFPDGRVQDYYTSEISPDVDAFVQICEDRDREANREGWAWELTQLQERKRHLQDELSEVKYEERKVKEVVAAHDA